MKEENRETELRTNTFFCKKKISLVGFENSILLAFGQRLVYVCGTHQASALA
jgi:hypothetical protein